MFRLFKQYYNVVYRLVSRRISKASSESVWKWLHARFKAVPNNFSQGNLKRKFLQNKASTLERITFNFIFHFHQVSDSIIKQEYVETKRLHLLVKTKDVYAKCIKGTTPTTTITVTIAIAIKCKRSQSPFSQGAIRNCSHSQPDSGDIWKVWWCLFLQKTVTFERWNIWTFETFADIWKAKLSIAWSWVSKRKYLR